jgi:hypothetical protein
MSWEFGSMLATEFDFLECIGVEHIIHWFLYA